MAITRQRGEHLIQRRHREVNAFIVKDIGVLQVIANALSSDTRAKILYYLSTYGDLSITQLSKLLKLPLSVVSRHVKKLEEAGLVITGLRNGRHGLKKVVMKRYDRIIIDLRR